MTTSWTALVHGDLPAAFHAHLMGPLAYLGFTAVAFLSLAAARRGEREKRHRREPQIGERT
ncbi:DUF2752 domain-containing protein, partial [bacterium]